MQTPVTLRRPFHRAVKHQGFFLLLTRGRPVHPGAAMRPEGILIDEVSREGAIEVVMIGFWRRALARCRSVPQGGYRCTLAGNSARPIVSCRKAARPSACPWAGEVTRHRPARPIAAHQAAVATSATMPTRRRPGACQWKRWYGGLEVGWFVPLTGTNQPNRKPRHPAA